MTFEVSSKDTKIYLDIDGTIIHEELSKYNQPAQHLDEFLDTLSHFEVYWLTTHCRHGDPTPAQRRLQSVLSEEMFQYVLDYKPTTWDLNKTEGIDFNSDFVWFDNDVLDAERAELKKHNKENCLIEVNLIDNPDQLKEIAQDLLLQK